MPQKLLTFLGTTNYQLTRYTWKSQQVETAFAAKALAEFFHPDQVCVFVTDQAKIKNWQSLQAEFDNSSVLQAIDIPSGASEAELWEVFDIVVRNVQQDTKILFDITNAFRSIPLLILLAAAFLQTAKNVEIQGVYYGAFEANREQPPIFDLTPALKLLEWLTATDKFLSTGSSMELGQLLSSIQQDFYRQGKHQGTEVRPTKLKSLGDRIQAISDSIELVRPLKLMEETASLEKIPDDTLQQDVGRFAHPFALLLGRIQADYSQFALAKPQEAQPAHALTKQFDLLRWYVEKSLSAQAILLGREWVVSALCVGLGRDYLNQGERRQIEQGLNGLVEWTKNKETNPQPFSVDVFEQIVKDLDKLSAFWSKLRDMRNDLAHTEMRRDSLSASNLTNFVRQELLIRLQELFETQTQ